MTKYLLFIILTLTFLSGKSQITWLAPENIAPSSSGNNHPRIVTDASGDPMVVWYHSNRVMFSRWNGTGFSTPKIINPVSMTVAGASWMGPDIAAFGDTVYVVFKETPEHEGNSWCIHSYDGGASFSDPVQIDFIADSLSRFPTVTTDTDGNPIVAFMKFNSSFGGASWVVSRSFDIGNSFSPDVLASGWSSETSVVCDCCPGAIVSSDETVIMLYRDNNSNMRDSWAGFSRDGGTTFTEGVNIDQQNWMISSCPASGPDGVILGDTVYSTFMNGAGGKNLVYFNRTSLSNISSAQALRVTDAIQGLGQQNFPRISGFGKALGIVWKQLVNNKDQFVINFSSDITSGQPFLYDTVDLDQILDGDIVIWEDNIYVVWEDYGAGTVKFRSGKYEIRTAVEDDISKSITVFPNPSNSKWYLQGDGLTSGMKVELFDVMGRLVGVFSTKNDSGIEINNADLKSGVYFLRMNFGGRFLSKKLVKN